MQNTAYRKGKVTEDGEITDNMDKKETSFINYINVEHRWIKKQLSAQYEKRLKHAHN